MDYSQEYLGRDELAPGMLFYRVFDPTLLDNAATAMYRTIKADPQFSSKYNQMFGGGLFDFLEKYVVLAREWKTPLTEASRDRFVYAYVHKYGYSNDKAKTLVGAFLSSINQGTIPQEVIFPYEYEPTELHQDLRKYFILAGLALGGYIIISTSIKTGAIKRLLRK